MIRVKDNAIGEVRNAAKLAGMLFVKGAGNTCAFLKRDTKELVIGGMTFWEAYDYARSGKLEPIEIVQRPKYHDAIKEARKAAKINNLVFSIKDNVHFFKCAQTGMITKQGMTFWEAYDYVTSLDVVDMAVINKEKHKHVSEWCNLNFGRTKAIADHAEIDYAHMRKLIKGEFPINDTYYQRILFVMEKVEQWEAQRKDMIMKIIRNCADHYAVSQYYRDQLEIWTTRLVN